MKNRFALAALITLIGIPSFALAADRSGADGGSNGYAMLLARLEQKDFTVDFAALRRAYAKTSSYRPDDPALTALHRQMAEALQKGDDASAIRIARQVLARDYVDIDAHRVLARGADAPDFHRAVADRLLQSILDSGNGKAPETAYLVVSTDEEYSVLDHLGLQASAQSLVEQQGHYYDSLLVIGDAGKPFNIYFNIDLPFATLANGEME